MNKATYKQKTIFGFDTSPLTRQINTILFQSQPKQANHLLIRPSIYQNDMCLTIEIHSSKESKYL